MLSGYLKGEEGGIGAKTRKYLDVEKGPEETATLHCDY